MDYPGIVEERDSESYLARERFNRPADYGWVFVEHILKMGPDNLQYQHVVFSVWTPYPKMIQGSEDAIGSRVCPSPGRQMMINLDLVVLASKLGYDELEGDVSAASGKDCQWLGPAGMRNGHESWNVTTRTHVRAVDWRSRANQTVE